MKKLIVFAAFCAAALSLSAVSADAKASDPVHYRTEGYRGSVSLTNQYLAWIGVDTSHGSTPPTATCSTNITISEPARGFS